MTGFSAAFCIILMSVCSLTLMGLEAFIPGFSLAGIAGAAIMTAALFICRSAFGIPVTVAALLLWLTAALLIMRTVIRSMKSGKLSKSGVFLKTESAPTVPASAHPVAAGLKGVAHTPLRPAGIAVFDGNRLHVTAANGFIEKDAAVVVLRIEGSRIIVGPDIPQ